MKTIRNSLKAVMDRFEDPGDYPSGAGAGPLPPVPWHVSEVEGELVVELAPKELASAIIMSFNEFVAEETDGIDLPPGVLSVEWQVDSIRRIYRDFPHDPLHDPFWIVLSCTKCEPDPDYCGPFDNP